MTSCEEAEKRPITIQSLSIPQLIQILQLDAAMTRWLRKSWPGARREGLANDQGAGGPTSRGRPGKD